MGDILPPKRQAVVDRLRRRIESYRRRQTECIPRFDQTFSGVCEQQNVETSLLQKRFLEGKAKRQAKKTERKTSDSNTIQSNLHSSVHVQQKFGSGEYSPPAKMSRGGVAAARADGLTKFSVEIVQQLEFTTSAASSQPQQISTNVTVKALTNASVKSEVGLDDHQPSQMAPQLECKRELLDDGFADLDQCAAALDQDAAADFPGLGDLIGGDERGEIIDSDAFDDLISEISEYPEFMKDFDLDGKGDFTLKVEDTKDSSAFGGRLPPYGDLSPAAQTLKQMAEQHQHKAAAGAGAEWGSGGARGSGGPQRLYGGPYAPRPPPVHHQQQHLPHHLHMSQAQQMHISQPHHLIQVSAGQQMQLSGELKAGGQVSVAAQQGLYFTHTQHNQQQSSHNQQHTQQHTQHPQQHNQHHQHQQQNMSSPQHQQGVGDSTYTVSQSQTINFTQQSLRQRHQQQATPQGMHATAGPGSASQPGGGLMTASPNGAQSAAHINVAGAAREHHAKMLQQQQQHMLRAQHQQMQNAARPPPPEYKAATHILQHARLSTSAGGPVRAGLQPRAPQWRGTLMPSAPLGPTYHQPATFQQRFQQQRLQQHLLQQHHRAQHPQQMPQQNMMSHLVMQQNQVVNAQGQIPNIHMSQNQSISMQQQQHANMMMPTSNGMSNVNHNPTNQIQIQGAGPGPPIVSSQSFPTLSSSFPNQTADFNLDFLDSMPTGDSSHFTAQDLLNSLDNVPGFNLNDIL